MQLNALSVEAQVVMDKLTEGLKRLGEARKIDNSDGLYMPVSVDFCDFIPGVNFPVFSVCHYGEQNGDLMRDPEMLFFRTQEGRYIPYYFRNDYVHYEERSLLFERVDVGRVRMECNSRLQKEQSEFASSWMLNIKDQQMLEVN